MTSRVEMLLYHDLDETGSIEVSTTSSSGPWTKLTLSSTKPVIEALAEWEALATAAVPSRTWSIGHFMDGPDFCSTYFAATGGATWFRLSPCLAELLGHSVEVFSGGHDADQRPLGLIQYDQSSSEGFVDESAKGAFFAAVSHPRAVEEGELSRYRAGRAVTYLFGLLREVVVDLYVPPYLWASIKGSPILSGHCAMRVVDGNEDELDEDNLDGAVTVYPIETLAISRESSDDVVYYKLRATLEEA